MTKNSGQPLVNSRWSGVGQGGHDAVRRNADGDRGGLSEPGADNDGVSSGNEARDRASEIAAAWSGLHRVDLDRRTLARRRIVTAHRTDPSHATFDLLRTRLLQALKERGWRRVAITSPTQGCGKTFVAANLALSLARQASCRTVLLDLDMRVPDLANVLGLQARQGMDVFLSGEAPYADCLLRVGDNLALGLNRGPVANAAELIQEPPARAALATLDTQLEPSIALLDLPPTLVCDDVLAVLPYVDCVLMVVGGGKTTPSEVQECERLLSERAPLMGVVLNGSDDPGIRPYSRS